MEIPTIIAPQTAAAHIVINTAMDRRPGCLVVVGTLVDDEQIEVQRPLIADPDPDNDAHWAVLQQNDTDTVLRVGHDGETIPVRMILRISKPVTTNPVGVSWL